jgi:bifunctional non-homologous end joining protein LigD
VRGASLLVRLFTRRGFDWTDRYPAIAEAAAKLTARSFTIDGEAVVCGPDGNHRFLSVGHTERSTRQPPLSSAGKFASASLAASPEMARRS